MLDGTVVLLGLAIGLAVAAPLGPVNLIVIRATLKYGAAVGLAAGAGAVLADSAFAAVAAYGVRAIGRIVSDYGLPLQLGGGLLLVVMGVYTARHHARPSDLSATDEPQRHPFVSKAATTFFLTATNPGAFFGMLGLFGALGSTMKLGLMPYRPAIAVASVAAGGLLWWIFLTVLVHRLKSRLTAAALDRINRWAGVLIAAFGFVLLISLVY